MSFDVCFDMSDKYYAISIAKDEGLRSSVVLALKYLNSVFWDLDNPIYILNLAFHRFKMMLQSF